MVLEYYIVNCKYTVTLSVFIVGRYIYIYIYSSTKHLYVCICICVHTYTHTYVYTGCPRRNVPDFGRVFRMLKYTDITQNTYVQS